MDDLLCLQPEVFPFKSMLAVKDSQRLPNQILSIMLKLSCLLLLSIAANFHRSPSAYRVNSSEALRNSLDHQRGGFRRLPTGS